MLKLVLYVFVKNNLFYYYNEFSGVFLCLYKVGDKLAADWRVWMANSESHLKGNYIVDIGICFNWVRELCRRLIDYTSYNIAAN